MAPTNKRIFARIGRAVGLDRSTISRLNRAGVDVLDGAALVERYRTQQTGRRPKSDAKVIVSPRETIDAVRRLKDAVCTKPPRPIA